MSSLKDALLKAGVKSTKTANMRETVVKRERKKTEKHQQERNFCEVCEFIQPDVERFKHKNPTVDAEWICAACADKEEIHDQFRITNQSEFSKKRRYRREFGPTKDFSDSGSSKRPTHKKSKRHERKDTTPKEARHSIDEDGEKNFNC